MGNANAKYTDFHCVNVIKTVHYFSFYRFFEQNNYDLVCAVYEKIYKRKTIF